MSRKKKLKTLERRHAYLQERIELCIGSPAALGWMKAEAAALEWALDELSTIIDLREEDNGGHDNDPARNGVTSGCEDSVSGRLRRYLSV